MGIFNKLFKKEPQSKNVDENTSKLLDTLPKNVFAIVEGVFNIGDCAAVTVRMLRDEIHVGDEIELNGKKTIKILEIRTKKVEIESANAGDIVGILLAVPYDDVKEGDLLSKVTSSEKDFYELIKQVNNIDIKNKEQIKEIVDKIYITDSKYDDWIGLIFSEKINLFDMTKLTCLIEQLYQTTDKYNFLICRMLLESSCDKLKLIPNLENYPIFVEKYKSFIKTLVKVYATVDNGVDNCMSLILLKYDPKMKYLDDDLKKQMVDATIKKLSNILNYLSTNNINSNIFKDLEIIIDVACYLQNNELNELIDKIDNSFDCNIADIYIIKYKAIHNMPLNIQKIERIRKEKTQLKLLFKILEELNIHSKYLNDVTQEEIAYSKMINWLIHPTEFNSMPDTIKLLGEFEYNSMRFFAYKFSKKDFSVKGELLGISGGYPNNYISSFDSGYTFSKFEKVSENWIEQSKNLVNFMEEMYKNKKDNQ